MVDYPARPVNYTSHPEHPDGQVFQIYDERRHEEIKDLSLIKYFPYYIVLHSLLVLWPMTRAFYDTVSLQIHVHSGARD